MNARVRYAVTLLLAVCAIPCRGAELTHAYATAARDAAGIAARLQQAVGDPEGLDDVLLRDIAALKRYDTTRWVGATEGDVVEVFGLYYENGGKHLQLGMVETPRDRRIDEDLRTLAKLALKISEVKAAQRYVFVDHAQFRLREVRARVKFSAELLNAAEPVGADEFGDAKWIVILDLTAGKTNKANAALATKEVITGPREAWSMSVALPVNTASQLKLNTDTNEIEPKDEPGSFYVSLDYTFGDYFLPTRKLPDALVVKLMMKASKEPLDSYGAGIALKAGFFDRWPGFEILDRVSPFVGWTFTREDVTRADGTIDENGGRNSEIRYGLSYDLSRALDWVKK